MSIALARAVVLIAGAAVLVVETLAARLVAPYVGLTLESQTAAIGVALLGIAAGAQLGGRLADRVEPRRVAAAGLAVGGILVLAVRPIVHLVGPTMPPGAGAAVMLIGLSTLAPVIGLSMVAPAVVRARLSRIEGSGTVVGSLSALGTIGALAGTFLTGFVFVATLPIGTILAGTSAACVLLSFAVARHHRRDAGIIAAVALVLAVPLALVEGPCDVETTYYCARVEPDPAREGGRVLFLDNVRHSYVDLDTPEHLEFTYIKRFASAVDAHFAEGRSLDAVHVGGGGFTMPRWLASTRPGSRSTVLELDRGVVDLGRARLGVGTIPALEIVTGDARISLRRLPSDSADLIVCDAFGSLSVPWHLATREFLRDVERVARPDALVVLNIIDYDPHAFLRAETRTVASVFEHVALMATPDQLGERSGGNFVLVASDAPLDASALAARVAAHGEEDALVTGAELNEFVAGSRLLTDSFAPVDQLLTPYRT